MDGRVALCAVETPSRANGVCLCAHSSEQLAPEQELDTPYSTKRAGLREDGATRAGFRKREYTPKAARPKAARARRIERSRSEKRNRPYCHEIPLSRFLRIREIAPPRGEGDFLSALADNRHTERRVARFPSRALGSQERWFLDGPLARFANSVRTGRISAHFAPSRDS